MRILLTTFCFLLVSCSGLHPRYHELSAGESLERVAAQYHVSLRALKKYNSAELSVHPHAGEKIYIPYETRADWNEPTLGADTDLSTTGSNGPAASDAAPEDQPHFTWPLFASVTSYFGTRHHKMHEGIDIGAPTGTPVRAARSGHVIYAGNRIRGYGNMVIIKHADKYSTVYAHLSRFKVKKGQFVARGQLVGLVGHTGHAFGSHLHFEVRYGQTPKDPLFFLQARYAHNTVSR